MPDVLDTLTKLPKLCAARSPSDNSPILIRRGETGYYPYRRDLDVDVFNARHGVTPAQREAMLYGSCFGWEAPAADPDNHADTV